MISSKALLKLTGISRATLNNYIKNGLLPKPVIRTGDKTDSVSSRLGFFPESAIKTIEHVQILKDSSMTMKDIIGQLAVNRDDSKHKSAYVKGDNYQQDSGPITAQQSKPIQCIPVVALFIRVGATSDIKSLLLADEYFSFLNHVWAQVVPILNRMGAVIGAAADEGLVCYFISNTTTSYLVDSIKCGLELQALAKGLTTHYQKEQNWSQDIFINLGIAEGREWIGTIKINNRDEFRCIGNTGSKAKFLSEIAIAGEVLIAKNLVDALPSDLKPNVGYRSPKNINSSVKCYGHFATYIESEQNISDTVIIQYDEAVAKQLFTELTHFYL